MKYFEIEGVSVDEAINSFTLEHNIPKDYLDYEVLEEGSKGFLGFGKKKYKLKIKYDDILYIKKRAKILLSELLEKAGFSDFSIETKDDNPNYILNILTADSSLLIGKMAQTLNALQDILDKMLGIEDNADINIVLDVESYRQRIVQHLTEKAVKLANQVKKTGKPERLPPMVTIIRKEIHMAVKGISGVRTESSGKGNVKIMFIVPEKYHKAKRSNKNA